MPKNDFDRLFDQLESLTVGFAPVFRDFTSHVRPSYPPHNIIRVSDTVLQLELAVAGFKKDEISVEEHQGLLTIKGEKVNDLEPELYQYRGIANRSFVKQIRVAEFFEVTNAKIEDGILTITFVKNVPDQAKPKLIAIS